MDKENEFLTSIGLPAIITWMTEYPEGRLALRLLAQEIIRQDDKRRRDAHAEEKAVQMCR